MRYVQRDSAGRIVGHFANPQPYALEEMPDDDAEILSWEVERRPPVASPEQRLQDLERRLRILERGE